MAMLIAATTPNAQDRASTLPFSLWKVLHHPSASHIFIAALGHSKESEKPAF